MKTTWARRVCSHHALCGISHAHLARLVNELAAPWTARHEAALEQRRGRARQRATGAGPNHHLVFADRLCVTLRIDGTEVQVRRPRANRAGRKAFVSGKKKQNTIKPTVVGDGDGRMLWAGATRPGRMHDATAVRTEGIEDLLRCH